MSDQALPVIGAPRLDLVVMTAAFFERCLADDRAGATAELGAGIADEWWEERGLMRFWLDRLRADPAVLLWLARAIVLREGRLMIGHAGFHGPPGMPHLEQYAPGGVEMGYTVYPPYRRQGYASEALAALMGWAAAQGVPAFVLSIAPANAPSQAIARRFGFVKVGAYMDPEDGLEDVYLRRAT